MNGILGRHFCKILLSSFYCMCLKTFNSFMLEHFKFPNSRGRCMNRESMNRESFAGILGSLAALGIGIVIGLYAIGMFIDI